MSSVLTEPDGDYHFFNLAVWEELCADPQLAALDYRIETDRYGQIVMSPPPAPSHGNNQSEISFLLRLHSKERGKVISECPVSTTDGVKAADNAWCSDEVWESLEGATCFLRCPELLIEVISPSNTKAEIRDKKKLYFESGASEVWLCDGEGKITFYAAEKSTIEKSELFPEFPDSIG